ncbi:hypothetical protein MA16_Dca014989 [Dendrobium catenatum]|uniref:Uncharacterized protein n=1 Tax=Dendrobium catenatum TaxID=906689 RepID=A0A2I0VDQ4_9ASPA|nr:hypothetical protein MA16_Dca014989 [Dendrobium catenatum]
MEGNPLHDRRRSMVSGLGISSASDMMRMRERRIGGRRSEGTVDDFVGGEGEKGGALIEEQGFGEAGEGGVGFEEEEAVDEGEESAVAEVEDVEFIVEDDCVENAARGGAVEVTEEGEGGVGGVEVREAS